MKNSISLARLVAVVAAAAFTLTACGDNNQPVAYAPVGTAPVQVAAPVDPNYAPPAAVDPNYAQPAPVAVANPNALVGCPSENYALHEVLAGVHGVDQYQRPLNACGIPVNVYGQPLEAYAAPQVFYARPAPNYLSYLALTYSWYRPMWGVGFYHPYAGVGVVVNPTYYSGGIPATSITRTYVRTAPANETVRVPMGNSQTVRPGAPANTAPVTARPNATPATPAVTPATPAYTRPGATPATPAVTPAAPAYTRPAATPAYNRPAATPSTPVYNRPAAPSISRPAYSRPGKR